MLEIVPSVFNGPGKVGDFGWMLEQSDYSNALFVFNDNQEQYEAFRDEPHTPAARTPGGGNAVIRPWQCKNPPRAIGIPTGVNQRGYESLTNEIQAILDEALSRVAELTASGDYERLFYSAAPDGGLGTGIFRVGIDVKEYIVAGLLRLGG